MVNYTIQTSSPSLPYSMGREDFNVFFMYKLMELSISERIIKMGKSKKKQPGVWQQCLMILFSIITCGLCGFFIGMYLVDLLEGDSSLSEILFSGGALLITFYIAIFLQIIIHEGGHLIFGLLTGYKFSSFRIGSFMWIKDNDKLRFRRLSIAGTGGQCLLVPPDLKNGKIPFVLYNFGGSIMNLIASGIFGALYFLYPKEGIISTLFAITAIIGVAFAIMNGIPLRLGTVDNDGYNALSMEKNPEALKAFYLQMKINEQITKGVRLKDMPEEWFSIPSEEDMKNSMVAALGVFACNRLMDSMKFSEADETMEQLIKMDIGIIGLYRSLMVVDRIYCELIDKNRPEVLDNMMDKSLKQFMKAMKNFPPILRTQYSYALLAEKDEKKADEIKSKFKKIAMSYPHPSEITSEEYLMDYAFKISTNL